MSKRPDFIRYETLKDATNYAGKLETIGHKHGFSVVDAQPSLDGVNETFHLPNELVVKFFSASTEGWQHEARILEHLIHQTQVPTPKLLYQGEINGTPYVVMTEVPGVPLWQVWEELSRPQEIAIREQIGDVMRQLHQQPLLEESWPHTVFENLPDNAQPSWLGFLQTRRKRIVARQRQKGCPQEWLHTMPLFLDDVTVHHDDVAPLVLLHGELNANHIYVQKQGETWNVSGLIDFQASTPGTAKHELSHAGFFLCWGDAELLRALLRGYGWPDQDLTVNLQRQFMAHFLLFVWCPFQHYVQNPNFRGDVQVGDFDALAGRWWNF